MFRSLTTISFLLLYLGLSSTPAETRPGYTEVSQIFAKRCIICHSGSMAPLGLRMDSLEAIINGSDRGPVVESGQPANSELVKRLKGDSLPRMPMTGPPYLSGDEVAIIEAWISGGLAAGDPVTPTPTRMPEKPVNPGDVVTYLQVAPILVGRCAKCHSENGLMGPAPEGLVLTSYQSTLDASERAWIVPGNPVASELFRRIRGQALPRMPFDGPPYLQQAEIELIEKWIADGARSMDGKPASITPGARVRLHGTLTAPDQIDGLQLIIGQDTRIDKNPAVGSYVQVRGRIDAGGRVLVERLRRR